MGYISFDPWLQKKLAVYTEMEDHILDGITERAWDAFSHWRTLKPEERCLPLAVMADILKQRRDAIAVMMASEMGKPVTQGLAEADKCALLCGGMQIMPRGFSSQKCDPHRRTQAMLSVSPRESFLA